MTRLFFHGLIFLLINVFSSRACSQENNKEKIDLTAQNLPVKDFIHQLETRTSYIFYYGPFQLDSIFITVTAKNESIEAILAEAFKNNAVLFSIDSQHHIFLTKKVQVVTELPPGFFETYTGPTGQKQTLEILTEKEIRQKTVVSENKLYEIGIKTNNLKQGTALLTGYIRNSKTGEALANASVFIEKLQRGVATDQYGYYSITIPTGNHILNVQGIGMKDARFQVMVYSDGKLNMELKEQVNTLKEVIVSARQVININRVQMGVEHLNIATIKQVPTVFGEGDILRVVLNLPGVKTVGEASTGFNVRGGSADQNLILLNDATIYNPSHFFGLFSAFNPEIIKDVELYKSSIPARYGGRLSSVLDIKTREGNNKKFTGSAGIGLITSRLNIEGPLVKDKTSFVFGGRTTYANWLLGLLPSTYKNSRASFFDLNLGISHHVNAKNDLFLTAYMSGDHFNLASDTTYSYSNRNLSLKWKHTFNNKLSVVFTSGIDQYRYQVESQKNKLNAYRLSFDINQVNFKSDFNYYIDSRHTLNFGLHAIHYKLHPGDFVPVGSASFVKPDYIAAEQALETALYISDKYTITTKLSAEAGLRYSIYNYLGPGSVNIYATGLPRDTSNITQVKNYSSGSFIKTYQSPELRISLRYAFTPSFSIKAAYNSLDQYIHVLSNTTAIAPTDIWKLSDFNIKPQKGDQVSLGFYKNLKSNTIETSVEIYYKRLKDYLDYKPGATLIMNHAIESDVINTRGKAYGIEFMVKKETGKLNGWFSYTYSRILLQMDDPAVPNLVNHGNYYPANYDIPHDVTVVGNFKVNHRFSMSVNLVYSTGRPITLPVGRYYYGGSQRVLYSDRNAYRIPDYFRSDFSMNIDGNYKVKQKTHNSWTIGFYNITGRKNPYSVYFISENGFVNGYRLSIFGSIIPFVNFNIRF